MKPRAWLLLADKIFALVLFFAVGGTTNQTLAATPAEYSVETLVRGLDTPWAIDFASDGRDVVEGPDKALYVLTSNHDGRGRPGPDDDRVIRLVPK